MTTETRERPFTNTTYIVILIKEMKKEVNTYNGYLLEELTKAIDKEAKVDYCSLDLEELRTVATDLKYSEVETYFNNLLEVIAEREIAIAERNYYNRVYADY